jgi:2-iminobutanoate/2-iminopropanoate deaminase
MPKQEIKHPDKQVSTGAYSAGIAADGWLYVSGQGPLDLRTGEVVRGSIEDETTLTLEHVEKVLRAGGCGMDDVVKCAVHLLDIGEFDRFNDAYKKFFKSRGVSVLPARTTVQSILWSKIKIEIDVVARIPK